MYKKIIFLLSLTLTFSLACSQAQAGIWDSITSFFGSDEKEVQAPEKVDATQAAGETEKKSLLSSANLVKGLALVPLLTERLGISSDQAKGGMGALLQAAQTLMPKSDFNQLSSAIPGASTLLSLAPVLSKTSDGAGGGALSSLGGALSAGSGDSGNALSAGTQLVSQFDQLGLSADMIPKFTDTASEYLNNNEKSDAAGLLSKLKFPSL